MESNSSTNTNQMPCRIDGERYRSEKFLQREITDIFSKTWLVASPSGILQKSGSFVVKTVLESSIIITRTGDGQLHAFHNSCLHRGTGLLDGQGNTDCIECPYHGWRYGLDGKVLNIPGIEGMNLDVPIESLQLHKIAVAEAIGLIWVCFERNPPDLLTSLGSITDELAAYRLNEMRPIQEKTWEIPCNWKAVLDNATESYHLGKVHPWTIENNVDDIPDFATYGDNARLTISIAPYKWRRILDKISSRGGPYTERQQDALQKYVLFPNTLINVIPCHLTIFQIWPIAPDKCLFFYGFYGRKDAMPLEWIRARLSWLFSRWVLHEDKKILVKFQTGASCDHVKTHWLHQSECAIAHHHASIDRWIKT